MTSHRRHLPIAATLAAALLAAFATEAGATCVTAPIRHRGAAPITQFAGPEGARAAVEREPSDPAGWLVGMWTAEFRVGDALYDQTFQHFHSDGTENILSNGLPPSLGNVCLGVWKQVGPRTVRLRHMAWNWDADGHFAGTFVMVVTLKVDRAGNRYTGTFVADSLDLSGDPIPELHVEGVVRATRITVD
jgi:hypothetical protein